MNDPITIRADDDQEKADREELDYMDDDTFDPQEDDGSLDIEEEDNWVGELRKVGLKPKEIPMDRAL
jgi:hypothetical protein